VEQLGASLFAVTAAIVAAWARAPRRVFLLAAGAPVFALATYWRNRKCGHRVMPRHAEYALRHYHILAGALTIEYFKGDLGRVNDTVLRHWAAVLRKWPTTRLVLMDRVFNCASTREAFRQRMHGFLGPHAPRVDLLPAVASRRQRLAQYRLLDVALDPWPVTGTLHNCEAPHNLGLCQDPPNSHLPILPSHL